AGRRRRQRPARGADRQPARRGGGGPSPMGHLLRRGVDRGGRGRRLRRVHHPPRRLHRALLRERRGAPERALPRTGDGGAGAGDQQPLRRRGQPVRPLRIGSFHHTAARAPSASAGPNGKRLSRRARSASPPPTRPRTLPNSNPYTGSAGWIHAVNMPSSSARRTSPNPSFAGAAIHSTKNSTNAPTPPAAAHSSLRWSPLASEAAASNPSPTPAPTHGIHHGMSQIRRSMIEMAARTTTSQRYGSATHAPSSRATVSTIAAGRATCTSGTVPGRGV